MPMPKNPSFSTRGESTYPMRNEMDDDLIVVEGELPPKLPDGDYDAVVSTITKVQAFGGRWVVRFQFQIVSQGPAFGQVVPGYTNLNKSGRSIGPKSRLASWMRRISEFTGERRDRISLRRFKDFWFTIRTGTVTVNASHQPLPLGDQHATVREILDVIGKRTEAPAAPTRIQHGPDHS